MTNKEKVMNTIIFGTYILIFFTIDYLNMPYAKMIKEVGFLVVLINIIMNIVMSYLSLSIYQIHEGIIKKINKEVVGSNTSLYAVLFGMLTYGCTPCVISFFAVIGINFTIIALPWAGLPYKFISLLILIIGLWFSKKQQMKHCKI